ncbi:hypothetical protein BS50DRAFT_347611 [Corynespora cassiicola Philippines]|uniref:Uncharacterized protein n=1 Tax=Corynespora cassiicola Philippines TaxID=1448308 RepID=A0A2T2NQQ9_CORCC|nr:hypothetical protein BS50DRAFT_347611 [Corynespora cassiicola Philippines]
MEVLARPMHTTRRSWPRRKRGRLRRAKQKKDACRLATCRSRHYPGRLMWLAWRAALASCLVSEPWPWADVPNPPEPWNMPHSHKARQRPYPSSSSEVHVGSWGEFRQEASLNDRHRPLFLEWGLCEACLHASTIDTPIHAIGRLPAPRRLASVSQTSPETHPESAWPIAREATPHTSEFTR